MKNSVLLLGGDGTQTLPMAKSLSKKGYDVHMFYKNKMSYGYGSQYVKYKVRVPSNKEEHIFKEFFISYVKKKSINVVIPLSDATADFLSKYKYELNKYCRFMLPDYEVFQMGYDKNKLMKVCQNNNFPHPRTYDMSVTSIDEVEDAFFPAILKPNHTCGGRGMKVVYSRLELEDILEITKKVYGNCHLQKFVKEGGRQFKVELFIDENQHLINYSVMHKIRYFPVNGGSSSCNVTIKFDDLVEICHSVLRTIGWIGFADFDLIEDPEDGVIKIMEINPRIPACIKSAIESGIDYAGLIVDSTLGYSISSYKYTPGYQLRHIGFELLWWFSSRNRFKAKPNWFKFHNKNLSFQDISMDDPLPFVFGTIGSIKKLIIGK